MELTRRCDYACRILRSAYKHTGHYISIAEISEEEGIPYAFARTIQHDLAQAGYVRTVRGSRGGLMLAVDPADVTVLDIMNALQGPVSVSPCAADPASCPKSNGCTFHKLWRAADRELNKLFASVTLQEVLDGTGEALRGPEDEGGATAACAAATGACPAAREPQKATA